VLRDAMETKLRNILSSPSQSPSFNGPSGNIFL
jgi:hypothetical protein